MKKEGGGKENKENDECEQYKCREEKRKRGNEKKEAKKERRKEKRKTSIPFLGKGQTQRPTSARWAQLNGLPVAEIPVGRVA